MSSTGGYIWDDFTLTTSVYTTYLKFVVESVYSTSHNGFIEIEPYALGEYSTVCHTLHYTRQVAVPPVLWSCDKMVCL